MGAGGFIPPHGGYQQLQLYRRSLVVYQATRKFCREFFNKYDRTIDQVVRRPGAVNKISLKAARLLERPRKRRSS